MFISKNDRQLLYIVLRFLVAADDDDERGSVCVVVAAVPGGYGAEWLPRRAAEPTCRDARVGTTSCIDLFLSTKGLDLAAAGSLFRGWT